VFFFLVAVTFFLMVEKKKLFLQIENKILKECRTLTTNVID